MQKNNIIILSSVLLLLVVPGIALDNVFAEKLIVGDGLDNPVQFSGLDKTTGVENQLFSDNSFDLFLSSTDFALDGKLIGASSENKVEEQVGFYEVSLIINEGVPEILPTGINNDFIETACTGLSHTIDGVLYCMNSDGLHTVDLNAGTLTLIGNPVITIEEEGEIEVIDSEGNGLAISSDGTIYLSNQIGLYTLDSVDATATLVVKWDHNGDEIVDEPHVSGDDNLELGECIAYSIDFDSTGVLYAMMNCEEESVLAKIGLNPPVIPAEDEEGEPIELADLTLFLLERNEDLGDIFELGEMIFTESLTFSPFDFDFLLGNTYGTIDNYDDTLESITATINEDGNFITTEDAATISICDNAELSFDAGAGIFAQCHNTSITVDSGDVGVTLTADDEEIEQITTTLSDENSITFDSTECELVNDGVGTIEVYFEGETTPVIEGDTFSCLAAIDHYLGYNAKDKSRHHYDDDYEHNDDRYRWDDIKDLIKDKDWKKAKDLIKDKDWKKVGKLIKDKDWHKHHNHDRITVNLVDEFAGDVNYQVKGVKNLFNPAEVSGGEEIGSEESHLVSYQIKKIKGEPKFKGIKDILVTNQFGDLTVDVKNPKQLLVPSAKSHDSTPDELEKIVINHFKCYKAKVSKDTPKFEKRTVDVKDQFGSATMQVQKPIGLCTPVDKNSEGVVNDENYLMCYDLKKIKGEPKFKKINVFTNNQFGPEELEVKKPKHLCVPSTILLE